MLAINPATDLGCEVAQLQFAIDRETTATGVSLSWPERGSAGGVAAEREELRRQLAALHERAAGAQSRNPDLRALRSELATLLSFAQTLRADAEACRAVRDEALAELEREKTAARHQRERWLAEHQELVRRRDALQLSIDETARRVARRHRGDCRRTVPVFAVSGVLIVCSVTVSSPWSRFRPPKLWLVTLNESRDEVLVTRC